MKPSASIRTLALRGTLQGTWWLPQPGLDISLAAEVMVAEGASLTVEAGTIVKASPGAGLAYLALRI